MSKFFCKNPFQYCDIDIEGNIYVCCNQWCSFYSIGNILEEDFYEIFTEGKKFQEFINQFKNQNFKYCNIDMCLCAEEVDDNNFTKLFNEFSANKKRQMRLNFDTTCNLQCIFCRPNFEISDVKEAKNIEKLVTRIKSFLPELDANHWEISLNGLGEIFVSRPLLDLIQYISQNYKNIKFQIITNGVLCSKDMLERLGIADRISSIEVSVHATKEKTYNKLIKGGNFEKVRKNLEYISSLKQQDKINSFYMNFVITSYNYKEMLDFAKWSIKLGAVPNFLPLLPLNESQRRTFEKLNIANQDNPKYNHFIKVIKRLKLLKDYINIPEHYFMLKPVKQKFFIQKLFSR